MSKKRFIDFLFDFFSLRFPKSCIFAAAKDATLAQLVEQRIRNA